MRSNTPSSNTPSKLAFSAASRCVTAVAAALATALAAQAQPQQLQPTPQTQDRLQIQEGPPMRPEPQAPQAPRRYRGMIVCEKMADTPNTDILHVPLDLVVREGNAEFARPTFNATGTRVTGSELGFGTLDADGKVHLTSQWSFRDFAFHGDYVGTLTATGGTISGTQTWQGPNNVHGSRSCHAALVPAPKVEHAAQQ